MAWYLNLLWVATIAVGGMWWMADRQERFGKQTFLGLLPWSRGVLLGGLLFGLSGIVWLVVAAFIPIAAYPGLGMTDSTGRCFGQRIPKQLGVVCLWIGETLSALIGSIAIVGLLVGSQSMGTVAAWVFESGRVGLFSAFFGPDVDPSRFWQILAALWGIAIVYLSHALVRQMKRQPATNESPPAPTQ